MRYLLKEPDDPEHVGVIPEDELPYATMPNAYFKDRFLTPSEVAAYLLGAPASSFPVEAPKDEEGGS